MTDFWSTQEGRIADGLTINCVADGAITEGAAVKFGTTVAGQITVSAAAALGDGWGVAVRATSASGDPCPVLVYGLFKMTHSNGSVPCGVGSYVMNSTTVYVAPIDNVGTFTSANCAAFKGTSYLLGMAMQKAAATGDEIIIHIGKAP